MGEIEEQTKQRAIGQKLVDLALEFCVECHKDKVILNRQSLQLLITELKAMEQAAQKAADKGGLVVIREGDTLVTTYRFDRINGEAGRSDTASAEGEINPDEHEEGEE
jgi:glutaredoxin